MKKIIKFDNNLRLVYEKLNNVRSLSIGIFVNSGSINEEDDQKGISHFIEHILFKGTKKRSAFDIALELEELGVNVNAYTSKLITAYYTVSTDEHILKCFDILSDIFFNSSMTKTNLNKERNVILEEINMCQDDAEDLCFEQLAIAHYGENNNCSSPILGDVESVKRFTKEDCLKYMQDYYTADNTVISVAGNFDEKELIKLTNKFFTKKFKNLKAKEGQEKFIQSIANNLVTNKPIEQANVGIAFPAFSLKDDRHTALNLVSNLLGGGMSSRLFQRIRENLGIVYTVYATTMQYRENGHLCIYFATNPNTAEKAIKAIKKEINSFIKDGITEAELKKGKEQIKSSLVLSVESSSAVMRLNGRNMVIENEMFDLNKKLEEINDITLEQVNDIVKEVLNCQKASLSYVGKELGKNLLDIFRKSDKI